MTPIDDYLFARFPDLASSLAAVRRSWLGQHSELPPSFLHHYTGIDGLHGIVNDVGFHATHASYLNDAGELSYPQGVIREAIFEEAQSTPHTWFRALVSANRDLTTHPGLGDGLNSWLHPFLACFCATRDLLSQWRGYGHSGPAYSLVLDLRQIVRPPSTAPRPVPILRKVIYDRAEQKRLVRATVQAWADACQREIETDQADVDQFLRATAIPLLHALLLEHHVCFKSDVFKEEQEWRLIRILDRDELRVAHVHGTSCTQCYKRSHLGFVPYITILVKDTVGHYNGRLPLKEVMIGPTPHADIAKTSLEWYLEHFGYSWVHTKVTTSKILLRT